MMLVVDSGREGGVGGGGSGYNYNGGGGRFGSD